MFIYEIQFSCVYDGMVFYNTSVEFETVKAVELLGVRAHVKEFGRFVFVYCSSCPSYSILVLCCRYFFGKQQTSRRY